MPLTRPLDPEKVEIVEAMPRRMAHALHALIYTSRESGMPPTAAEVCIYDGEALSVKATAAALREAARRGYCATIRGIWVPANAALELRNALEDRYLRETEDESLTAYGEHEIARWRYDGRDLPGTHGPVSFSPQILVLTQKKNGKPGRLLRKYDDGTYGYSVLKSACSLAAAEEYAQSRGFERTYSRR